jgi:hypothetical protein
VLYVYCSVVCSVVLYVCCIVDDSAIAGSA